MQLSIRKYIGNDHPRDLLRLRYLILRAPLNLPFETAVFEGDDSAHAIHFLAYRLDTAQRLACPPSTSLGHSERQAQDSFSDAVGCATIMVDPEHSHAQLRGMAVASSLQGGGVGRELLRHVHRYAEESRIELWCKARETAVAFYEKQGWTTEGDYFEVPDIGRHIRMRRK